MYSVIIKLPKIAQDKISHLRELCNVSNEEWFGEDPDRHAITDKAFAGEGLNEDQLSSVVDYLSSACIDDSGEMDMDDCDQKWSNQDVFAMFLEKYVDKDRTTHMVFSMENGHYLVYVYIDGTLYVGREVMTVDKVTEVVAKEQMKQDVLSRQEIKAFQEGIKYAWTLIGALT